MKRKTLRGADAQSWIAKKKALDDMVMNVDKTQRRDKERAVSSSTKGVLGEEEFRRLVAGKVIEIDVRGSYNGRVSLLLSDIGYDRMIQAIYDAEKDAGI